VRGPDRPGGNSLAEGQVFGHRAGSGAARYAQERAAGGRIDGDALAERLENALRRNDGLDTAQIASALREAMQTHCLVEKNEAGMTSALHTVREISQRLAQGGGATPATALEALSLENMVTTADVILQACLHRKESRSSHYRVDYPEQNDVRYGHSVVLQRDGDGIRYTDLVYPPSDASARKAALS
jgi:fumarate reductase (CoM/CoB) subunit A